MKMIFGSTGNYYNYSEYQNLRINRTDDNVGIGGIAMCKVVSVLSSCVVMVMVVEKKNISDYNDDYDDNSSVGVNGI